jgi:hypothetical protein
MKSKIISFAFIRFRFRSKQWGKENEKGKKMLCLGYLVGRVKGRPGEGLKRRVHMS